MATPNSDRGRMLRRRHQRERQAVIFGSLIAGLAVVTLGAAAVYTDSISLPFLDRDFTTPAPDADALPVAPCPPPDTKPVAYTETKITVLNGSGQSGLAKKTADALGARGFAVVSTGNSKRISENNQIRFGEKGIAAAYTLAGQLAAPVLVLDKRDDASVDLILGPSFPGLLDPTEVTLDPNAPLAGSSECLPLAEVLPDALDYSTPTPSASKEPQPAPAALSGG
jgi:hypothetical protein